MQHFVRCSLRSLRPVFCTENTKPYRKCTFEASRNSKNIDHVCKFLATALGCKFTFPSVYACKWPATYTHVTCVRAQHPTPSTQWRCLLAFRLQPITCKKRNNQQNSIQDLGGLTAQPNVLSYQPLINR